MNDIIKKESYFGSLRNYLKTKFKIILYLFLAIFIAFILFQISTYYKNKNLLNDSLKFNIAKNTKSEVDYERVIDDLSSKKNFYGLLANIEKIKINFKSNNFDLAYNNYLKILNNNKYKEPFKSAIAIQSAYAFLNFINKKELSSNIKSQIVNYINTLLEFVDANLESYYGLKLEILYLISIMDQDSVKSAKISDTSNQLYKEIQNNEKISSVLKERVKKIHEFQKYK